MPFTSTSIEVSADKLTTRQAEIIAQWQVELRPGQRTLANWRGGTLAVSAVPGAGKSHSMAVAAAITIAREKLHQRRQLVIVTLTRSAAANIKDKIRKCLAQLGLPPIGYSVNTIHSLALSIASKHPELSKLDLVDSPGERLRQRTLVTLSPNHKLIKGAVDRWLSQHPQSYQRLLAGESFDGEETERLRRQSVLRTEVLPSLAFAVVREAKSSGLTPTDLANLAELDRIDRYDILSVGAGLYQAYQEVLSAGRYLDYDEMISGALQVMADPAARRLWQEKIFAVFEDEAQDSSPLQEQLLRQLAGIPDRSDLPPNLIRVGDPNQAINSTFTPADPRYFREFCQECREVGKLEQMEQAGRSTQAIMDGANYVLDWGNNWLRPPGAIDAAVAESVFCVQKIRPVPIGDTQPNPVAEGRGIELYTPKDVYASIDEISQRLESLFRVNPNANAAILVRENRQAKFIFERLAEWQRIHPNIKIYQAGESDRTSKIPGEILTLFQFMVRPHSPEYLKATLKVLLAHKLIEAQDLDALAIPPEQFLYPTILDEPQSNVVERAKKLCCELLDSRLNLPHHHLIRYLGNKLNYGPSKLATADKLADRIAIESYGRSSIYTSIEILQEIVTVEGFEDINAGKDEKDEKDDSLYTAKGQVTIITMHKAKGLDWDYVFIPFLSDRLHQPLWVPNGAKFLGEFTLAEIARAKIRAHLHKKEIATILDTWNLANYLKQAEELRLLYVAMTRAKKLLWLAAEKEAPFLWNQFNHTEKDRLQSAKASPLFIALQKKESDKTSII
jgi:DNA helicase II / ATP-dependent DNA helicase PcrA